MSFASQGNLSDATVKEGAHLHRVLCAALLVAKADGDQVIVAGIRHFDELMIAHLKVIGFRHGEVQGFLDSRGNFLTREEAFEVATNAGQIVRRVGGDEGRLFSENLY